MECYGDALAVYTRCGADELAVAEVCRRMAEVLRRQVCNAPGLSACLARPGPLHLSGATEQVTHRAPSLENLSVSNFAPRAPGAEPPFDDSQDIGLRPAMRCISPV